LTGLARTSRFLPFVGLVVGLASCGGPSADTSLEESRQQPLASPSPELVPPVRAPPDSLITLGLGHYDRGEYQAAQRYLEEAVRRSRGERGTPARARALTWLGLAAWRQGDFAAARRLGEEALAIKLEAGLDDQLFRSLNALGLLAWYEARLADAVLLYEQAGAAAEAAGDAEGVAKAANNLGLVQVEFGEFDAAREGFERMRRAGQALEDPVTEGKALTNLAMLDVLIGRPRAAIPQLEEAIRLYRSVGHATGEENAIAQLGTAYRELGELGRAHAMLDSALSLARSQGLRPEEAADLEALADLYRDAGDYRRALELYEQAAEINEEVGLTLEAGADLRNQAMIYADLGDLEAAGAAAGAALRLDREVGNRFEELADRLALAEVAHLSGRTANMAANLLEARSLARALDSRVARVELALTEAHIADAKGLGRETLNALEGARSDLSGGDYASEWEAQTLRARAYLRLGQLDSAAVEGRRAVETIERVRGSFSSSPLRTAYAASRLRTYSDLVTILLNADRRAAALEIADAARGSGLSAQVARSIRGGGTGSSDGGTVAMVARGELLLRQIDTLVAAIDLVESTPPGERDAETARELRLRLERARSEYESHLIRVAEANPVSATLLGDRRVSAAEIRRSLVPGEVLLEYLVTPDRLVIFAVTHDDVRVAESLITAENLASRARLANGLVTSPDASPATAVLERLHAILIEPAARAASLHTARRLIIVPHGVLSYMPFAALRDGTSGRYLVEDFDIVHLPSAATLVAVRDLRRAGGAGDVDGEAQVFAPFPDRFPATVAEARAVERTIADASVLLGSEATEARVRRAFADAGTVHLATHGVMNARSPMFSRIELATGENGAGSDDGRLEVHEVLALRIRSSLVFLSGCETGLGAAWSTGFAEGEDYATLDRAFLSAGVSAVIATLWRIKDEGAAAFATRFYEELEVASPPEALARAQRRMLGDRRYEAPFYWAAYRLSSASP